MCCGVMVASPYTLTATNPTGQRMSWKSQGWDECTDCPSGDMKGGAVRQGWGLGREGRHGGPGAKARLEAAR